MANSVASTVSSGATSVAASLRDCMVDLLGNVVERHCLWSFAVAELVTVAAQCGAFSTVASQCWAFSAIATQYGSLSTDAISGIDGSFQTISTDSWSFKSIAAYSWSFKSIATDSRSSIAAYSWSFRCIATDSRSSIATYRSRSDKTMACFVQYWGTVGLTLAPGELT